MGWPEWGNRDCQYFGNRVPRLISKGDLVSLYGKGGLFLIPCGIYQTCQSLERLSRRSLIGLITRAWKMSPDPYCFHAKSMIWLFFTVLTLIQTSQMDWGKTYLERGKKRVDIKSSSLIQARIQSFENWIQQKRALITERHPLPFTTWKINSRKNVSSGEL